MKHPQIRAAVLAALKATITDPGIVWFDGRPGFLDSDQLPAIAVYLTDAKSTENYLEDEKTWAAILHIEVFLKADETDTVLDEWIENSILPVMDDIPALSELVDDIDTVGYDYQRDDMAMTWGSADLQYALTYSM
ncbi:phage tail protein [Budviciaceae bacterium CWB-B4]|uniref:Phage tail protein n=1 Tax=Limnobaculum xujianqingii TaxID=2738837 RepID=A0A9D7AGG7_9GAMM|nr:phage minor tail U family protein [Limnobaculum xujianqingii]MBK5072230.1 phage tail protein [Limnobaculum xujianqingii]MBK5175539.1 phage tail protein [Limnobaculum xujianqingii]